MVMPPCDTFDYVATAPENHHDPALPWPVRLRHPAPRQGDEVVDRRLVGYAPRLQIADAGPAPDPGLERDSIMRSRITLTASGPQDATVSSMSFYVERDLLAQLQPGDDLHVSRTFCGGLGLSIVRNGELVVAIGAVTAVDLGNDFAALSPSHLVEQASRTFKSVDPDFSFPSHPVEFVHKKQRRILFHGLCRMGQYEIFLRHGFLKGIPGTDESAAICKTTQDEIPAYASASAQLLENDPLECVGWPDE